MFTRKPAKLLSLTVLLLIFGATAASAQVPGKPTAGAATPVAPITQVNHVFIVMEENHGYSDVIGNPQMPYLNSLANTYSVAQGYYANTHPSIGNYFMLTTGQIITNDDGYIGHGDGGQRSPRTARGGKNLEGIFRSATLSGILTAETPASMPSATILCRTCLMFAMIPTSSRTWCRSRSLPPTSPIMLCRTMGSLFPTC